MVILPSPATSLDRASRLTEGRAWLRLVKRTVVEAVRDSLALHAAALAFFSLFALVPMFVLVIMGASLVWGDGDGARAALFQGVELMIGAKQGDALQEVIRNADAPGATWVASGVSAVVLVLTASQVFAYLEVSLNRVWDVERERPGSLLRAIRVRVLSIGMVLALVFLLLVSLLFGSIVRGGADLATSAVSRGPAAFALRATVGVAAVAAVFTLLLKLLPAARVRWEDALVGGVATSVLFALGQLVVGYALGGSQLVQSFGALSSIVIVLLWLYYTTLVFLVGAEFTATLARMRGRPLEPVREARPAHRKPRTAL